MTRKDYEIIAATIAYDMEDFEARREAALSFADTLHIANARFDEERFLQACLRQTDEWYWSDGRRWIGYRCADQKSPDHLRHVNPPRPQF